LSIFSEVLLYFGVIPNFSLEVNNNISLSRHFNSGVIGMEQKIIPSAGNSGKSSLLSGFVSRHPIYNAFPKTPTFVFESIKLLTQPSLGVSTAIGSLHLGLGTAGSPP
jgi:hypothetical protein